MRYTLFLRQRGDGRYEASVPVMPGVSEVADTREAAIQALARTIRDVSATAEFVSIEVPDRPAAPDNPWLSTAGSFADDDTLEPLLRKIYEAREPRDARRAASQYATSSIPTV